MRTVQNSDPKLPLCVSVQMHWQVSPGLSCKILDFVMSGHQVSFALLQCFNLAFVSDQGKHSSLKIEVVQHQEQSHVSLLAQNVIKRWRRAIQKPAPNAGTWLRRFKLTEMSEMEHFGSCPSQSSLQQWKRSWIKMSHRNWETPEQPQLLGFPKLQMKYISTHMYQQGNWSLKSFSRTKASKAVFTPWAILVDGWYLGYRLHQMKTSQTI